MRTSFLRLSLLGLASCSLLASCADDASAPDEDTAPNGAVIVRGQPLTPPSSAARDTIVREFLKTRGAGAAVQQLRVTQQTRPTRGVQHVAMEQIIDGLRVHGAYAKAAIDTQGRLIQVIDNVVRPQGSATKTPISASDALVATLDHLALSGTSAEVGTSGTKTFFEPGGEFIREPSAELVAYVDATGVLRQGYLVETWSRTDNVLEETLVGHDGSIVESVMRTASDSYNVFVEDPGKGGQVVVNGPASGGIESPSGWLGAGAQTSQSIQGNNVRAYLDAVSNNVPDGGGAAIGDGNFLAAADLAASPSTATNRDVAVQNLFYLNNIVHDALYRAGFTEAEKNFQADNFGRGGAAGDPVLAEAQDGGGVDNANFSTPTDGSSPRMQMYLWTPLGGHEVLVGTASYAAAGAGFGPALDETGLGGQLAVASVADGCTAFTGVTGKIAIVDRGNCDFTVKVMNAQAAGAIAAIVANSAGDSVFTMGGTNRRIKIPSVMVGLSSGAALKGQANATATVRKDPTPPPQIDGDLDADIVFHEYGHGLTWRMIGNMSGGISGALGEGASDTLAFFLNGDDRIGEYSFSDPNGIRRQPYATYTRTYKDLCDQGCQVHNDGEIYAAAMWRFRSLGLGLGVSDEELLGVWVNGMNFTPAGPSFENMRDGLVQAATLHSPALACAAWQAFAERGIGVGSSAKLTKGGKASTVVESSAVPASCQ